MAEEPTWKERLARFYLGRGTIRHAQAKYEEAIRYYRKSLSLNPYFAPTYSNIAAALDSLGRYWEAIEECNKALLLDPFEYGAIVNRFIAEWHLQGKS
jgi:tetratricopeptide (TPR) repeat protein